MIPPLSLLIIQEFLMLHPLGPDRGSTPGCRGPVDAPQRRPNCEKLKMYARHSTPPPQN